MSLRNVNCTGCVRVNITLWRVRVHCCRGKAILISYSHFVSVALAQPRFSALSHKRNDFRGWGGVEYEVCGFSFSATFV